MKVNQDTEFTIEMFDENFEQYSLAKTPNEIKYAESLRFTISNIITLSIIYQRLQKEEEEEEKEKILFDPCKVYIGFPVLSFLILFLRNKI